MKLTPKSRKEPSNNPNSVSAMIIKMAHFGSSFLYIGICALRKYIVCCTAHLSHNLIDFLNAVKDELETEYNTFTDTVHINNDLAQ